ncbi:uncharacterized protein LODBEIA_P16600 [Lodderomyces beijingensis]|uniref:holo-[acyl-carrier-protein] synthase n=1 Tax=Lodderomyces beijingensis TaxID=1775926 RepID=A0ABP0ZGZ5_9ASCO
MQHPSVLNHLTDSSVVIFTVKINRDLECFLQDDYNFETTLRLLNDLPAQAKIQSLASPPCKIKALVTHLFTRYVLNFLLQNPHFQEIVYRYTEYGKPMIAGLEFNSSSSNDIVAVAVTKRHPIGVDLSHRYQNVSDVNYMDQFRPIFHDDESVGSYFQFNLLWTLKEAFTKLLGCGLNVDLSHFCFSGMESFTEEEYSGGISDGISGERNLEVVSDCEWDRIDLNWCDAISINADRLFHDHSKYVENWKNEFYCYSSVLEPGSGEEATPTPSLPVIMSVITPFKVGELICYEVNMLKILSQYV